ncbi:hypothetical protein LHJ74_23455 [Streptomyces sp. N2-109]|uniref:Uncharacterized protein n=1 Tax=Streptomyces gossypii TaxID=2883101 RepID=A0ABT2JYU4_9ACTN|nr:hypothetical protein [Streptomyces gossypii]MCT2592833.1 hypothetical protein [Streptomyces gossypii]
MEPAPSPTPTESDTSATAEDPAPPDSPEAPEADPPRRRSARRRRTALLLAPAALLGIVAGLASGYTVQADRAPTALPPLSQEKLSYPAKPAAKDAVKPLSAKEDHRVKTDGDLRKLLLKKPSGAHSKTVAASVDGWVNIGDHGIFGPVTAEGFSRDVRSGMRRIATDGWTTGGRTVRIDLTQYRNVKGLSTVTHVLTAQENSYSNWPGHESFGSPMKRSGGGRYYVYEPQNGTASSPDVVATAIAWRGDIVMEITVFDTAPMSEKEIGRLAERQWALL